MGGEPVGRAPLQGPPARRHRPRAVRRAGVAAERDGGEAPGRGRARGAAAQRRSGRRLRRHHVQARLMAYDPFRRGSFPVGVRTLPLADPARGGRPVPAELWYPADDRYAGQDVTEATRDRYEVVAGFPSTPQDAVRDARARAGRWPLVVFSHGYGGHRRQSTFFCTHLASHGYVVVAPDHTGNTVADGVQAMMSGRRTDPRTVLTDFVAFRPADVRFVLD